MNFFDKTIYSLLNISRNKNTLYYISKVGNIDGQNMIIPNLYLGNINEASNLDFLLNKNIKGIVNCTEQEPYHQYFSNKKKYRLSVNDSREKDNIDIFKKEIINSIDFIDNCIEQNEPVYVHCYWGLMRSATVVTGYLVKKYKIPYKDAISIVQEKRPMALSSLYNFNEVLEYVEEKYLN
jgi:protein-tyrosine phosphatase